MSALEELHGENHFFGLRTQHSFASYYVFDRLFDLFAFDQVVELGTLEGGLSVFLWLECLVRGKTFVSVDCLDQRRFFQFPFLRLDILQDSAAQADLREIISKKRTLLYCDNGNKPVEVRLFSSSLKIPGSILGVHDWGVEITEKDTLFLKDLHLRPLTFINKLSQEFRTLQHFWVKE